LEGALKLGPNKVWLDFAERYGNDICQKKIMELERYYQDHREDCVSDFRESFRQICLKIKAMQLSNEKDKIGYLTYSMLRTAILRKKPIYLIEATNKEHFFDREECWGEYDPGWAFRFLDELEIELEEKRKLYLGQIAKPNIEQLKLQETPKYHRYVICFLRYVMPQAVLLPEFQEIDKEEKLEVRAGEYLDSSEVVGKVNRQTKEPGSIKSLLEDGNGTVYECETFTALNLAQGNYWGINLCYCDLRGSDLSNSQMQYSVLTGTKLNRAMLQGTNLSESLIYEADFGESILKGANFYRAQGPSGVNAAENWKAPGYFGVSFQKANLEGVNFKDANLKGANFTGANLKDVNFEGANLEKAVFLKETADSLDLDETQKNSIVWE